MLRSDWLIHKFAYIYLNTVYIRKVMKTDPRFKHIIHQFDPWHIAKSFVKKLTKASKTKSKAMLL